jgi:hypothetical protein
MLSRREISVNIRLFKKKYTLRSYEPQKIVKGHATAPYSDVIVSLNVQPLKADEMLALPEGERTTKRIKSFGPDMLTAADKYTSSPGDRLFYNGKWYECESSVDWNHTMLSHFRSEFVILKDQEPPPAVVAPVAVPAPIDEGAAQGGLASAT